MVLRTGIPTASTTSAAGAGSRTIPQTSLRQHAFIVMTAISSVSYPDPHWFWSAGSGTALVGWIRNPHPDPGEQKRLTKIEKSLKISCFEGRMFSFEGEGFCCSLDILYGKLEIIKL
jgi:hypothetical protein